MVVALVSAVAGPNARQGRFRSPGHWFEREKPVAATAPMDLMIHLEQHGAGRPRSEDARSVHVHHEGSYDLEGHDACRNERSTWESWRM
jgi:hypothetical protein